MKDYEIYSDPNYKPCPDEYVETVGTMLIMRLKSEGMVRGVRVSINKAQSKVQIGVKRAIGGYYEQTTDCQAAYESKQDPEYVAHTAVGELIENINRARAGMN